MNLYRTMTRIGAVGLLVFLASAPAFIQAGDRVLSNNRGDASSTWFITGEPTLVMNGFDLTPLGLTFPAALDRVTIAVDAPVADTPIDVLVYQDSNGGSPRDATLAGQTQTVINQSGVVTVAFPTPITITQPVVWVGFYLPVGFRFLADTSGTSVLTYWAWTPGGRFDVSNLATAQVFGPADGSAPVNLDMKGIARITAEISAAAVAVTQDAQASGVTATAGTAVPIVNASTSVTNLNVLKTYSVPCETLSKDTADISITYRDSIDVQCALSWPGYAPESPAGYTRRELLYDLTLYNDRGVIPGKIPLPITHCIRPNPADLGSTIAVGIAYGSPRKWEILPTLRVGDLVCAEINRGGGVSYFLVNAQ